MAARLPGGSVDVQFGARSSDPLPNRKAGDVFDTVGAVVGSELELRVPNGQTRPYDQLPTPEPAW